ncbi:cell wall hydrolase, SleB [Clostridium aceticum]|uniref:Cell wall hydrolase, SleB n=2 Tax=Clostridium aceticum TaxID=84022 RepID=A0A0G3W7R3_9CLOT|nr:cell wall hydrolase, SleB [Clostridium aceticum]
MSIVLIVVAIASVQIANAPDKEIKDSAAEVETYLEEETEEWVYETSDEEVHETDEEIMASSELTEKVEEKLQTAASSITSEEAAAEVAVVEAPRSTTSTANTVDMSPITSDRYTVKSGDTLFLIAERANLSLQELRSINNINTDTIYVGQVVQTKTPPQPVNVAQASSNTVVTRGSQREDDMYWLSRIIHAEAQGEPYQGKVAVGNVVLNRVRSSNFPNTIYGVVFDRQHGYVQFSPVIDGTIHNTPNRDSVQAATEALNGAKPVGDALYFLNPRKATNFWIVANRRFMKTIGDHDFYY